jgi:hypothetical protein
MSKHECEDCPFTTDDDYEAEQHTRDTDHCVEESSYSPEELHDLLYSAIKEFGTEAVETA